MTITSTTSSLDFQCPMCDAFPFSTVVGLGEHVNKAHRPAADAVLPPAGSEVRVVPAGQLIETTASGRFQTVSNGFGGTTTRRAPEAAPVRSNRYAGRCVECGHHVAAEAGRIEKSGGTWLVKHLEGDCLAPAPAAEEREERAPLEPGMYRVGETIYKVQRSRQSENLYAKRLGGNAAEGFHFDYEQGAIRTVRAEGVRLTSEEAASFGRETGTCCVCAALLTDPKSIAAGIGPVCAGRL